MGTSRGDNGVIVAAAARGDQSAWNDLVERYTPLALSVIRRYRLAGHDAADVNQTLWLRLVEHLHEIRDPQALPKWIVTTTSNECLRLLRSARRTRPVDPLAADLAGEADQAELDASCCVRSSNRRCGRRSRSCPGTARRSCRCWSLIRGCPMRRSASG